MSLASWATTGAVFSGPARSLNRPDLQLTARHRAPRAMPGSPPPDEARTRVRATKACNTCYKHRVRCEVPEHVADGETVVCSRCARLGLTCDWNREQKKRGPKAAAAAAGAPGAEDRKRPRPDDDGEAVADLRHRNAVLEGMLRKVLLQQTPDGLPPDMLAAGMDLLGSDAADSPPAGRRAGTPLFAPQQQQPHWPSSQGALPGHFLQTAGLGAPPGKLPPPRFGTSSSDGTSEEAARAMASLAAGPRPAEGFPPIQSFDFSPENMPSPQMTVGIYSRVLQLMSRQQCVPFPVLHTQSLLSNPYASAPLAHAVLGLSFRSPVFYAAARAAILESLVDRFATPAPELLVAAYIAMFDMMSTGYDYRYQARMLSILRLVGHEVITMDQVAREQDPAARVPGRVLPGVQREMVRRAMWAGYVMDKFMLSASRRAPLVPRTDVVDVALPAPDAVWTAPLYAEDPEAEEHRWESAKQISGRELFLWKERPGLLRTLAPTLTPLHQHIVVADLHEWLWNAKAAAGGRIGPEARARMLAALRDYFAVFLAPYAAPAQRGDAGGMFSTDITVEGEDYVLTAPRNNGLATTMMLFYNYFQMYIHSAVDMPEAFSSPDWYQSADFLVALQHAFCISLLLEQTMVWDPELESLDPSVLVVIGHAAACYVGLIRKLAAAQREGARASGSELLVVRSRISVTLEAARKLSRFMVSSKQLIAIMERLLGDRVLGEGSPGSDSSGGLEGNPWLERFVAEQLFGKAASGEAVFQLVGYRKWQLGDPAFDVYDVGGARQPEPGDGPQ
ncbi:hypothetical protein DFJ74DRAFT_713699 [Hyaloraphidium curvatum]|nr:hypothetical protein DFJ74DRAFT_713699 [Hyaloraphidium curvatum]